MEIKDIHVSYDRYRLNLHITNKTRQTTSNEHRDFHILSFILKGLYSTNYENSREQTDFFVY